MTELLRSEDLPRWVPGKILLASDQLGWGQVLLRSYRYAPSEVFVPPMRDFLLIAYREGPTAMDRKVDGPWSRELVVPGNVSLLTRAEESHWHWTSEIEVTHIYLTRELLANVSAEVFDRDIADLHLQDILKTDDFVLRSGIAALTEEAQTHSLGGRLFVDTITTQLCIQLLRKYATVVFPENRSTAGLSPLQAKLVAEYIEVNIDQQLSLAELARVAHVSASHFLRQFKLRFGTAPHYYVTQRRLACAQRLLSKTGLPIKEIAAKSGFSDQSHMTRVFQKYLRATPNAYRGSLGTWDQSTARTQ